MNSQLWEQRFAGQMCSYTDLGIMLPKKYHFGETEAIVLNLKCYLYLITEVVFFKISTECLYCWAFPTNCLIFWPYITMIRLLPHFKIPNVVLLMLNNFQINPKQVVI